MKYLILIIGLCSTLSYGNDLARGEFVSLNKDMTLLIKNDNQEKHKVKIDCIQPVSNKRFKKVKEFIQSKVKGKLLIYNAVSKNHILVGGVEDLTLSGLEWGIFALDKSCSDSKYIDAQLLGQKRKTGLWQK